MMSPEDKTKLDSLTAPTVAAASGNMTIWTGTQSAYDEIQTKDNTTLYIITES